MKEKNIIQRAHLFTHIYEPDEIAKEYQKSLKQVLKLYKKLKHDNDLMQAEFERLEDLEDDRDILKYRIRELEKENQAYLEELAGDKTAISLLYQKEKEITTELMKANERLNKRISERTKGAKLQEERDKEKAKNKELKKKLANRVELLDYTICKDYISKDKIRAKIEEFSKERYIAGEHLVVNILEKLLEEE